MLVLAMRHWKGSRWKSALLNNELSEAVEAFNIGCARRRSQWWKLGLRFCIPIEAVSKAMVGSLILFFIKRMVSFLVGLQQWSNHTLRMNIHRLLIDGARRACNPAYSFATFETIAVCSSGANKSWPQDTVLDHKGLESHDP